MREILFRGQTRRKGEKVRLDGTPVDGNWVYGGVAQFNEERAIIYQTEPEFHKFPVYADTVGQYTGLTDKNGKKVFEGDIVKIVDFQIGKIVFECGAMGIDVLPRIDWNYLDSEIACITGHDNRPYFCCNDNFISLWELMWNYNQEENACDVVEVIGNVHDNRLEDFYGR